MTTPLRLAVPNKGRLAEPAVELLRNAGLEFELSERRLSAAVRNADIELLFVRTEDVAEYVADGLVELGLTGADLVAEHGGACAPCCRSASVPARWCSLCRAMLSTPPPPTWRAAGSPPPSRG